MLTSLHVVCYSVVMILSIRGFSEELHKKLKVAAAIEGVTIEAIVAEAVEKRLSGVTMPVVESTMVPVVEHTSLGDSTVTVIGASKPKKRESDWAQGMCPKHGRMAMNGKFTCC